MALVNDTQEQGQVSGLPVVPNTYTLVPLQLRTSLVKDTTFSVKAILTEHRA